MIDMTKGSAPMEIQGRPLTRVTFEFSWVLSGGGQKGLMAKLNRMKGVDLDASVLAYEGDVPVAAAYFDNLAPGLLDNAVRHLGDARGRASSSVEVVEVDLDRIPMEITALACMLSSYKDANFASVNDAICRIFDRSGEDKEPIARIGLPIQGNNTAAVMATIKRSGNGWNITKQRKLGHGRTWRDLGVLAAPLVLV